MSEPIKGRSLSSTEEAAMSGDCHAAEVLAPRRSHCCDCHREFWGRSVRCPDCYAAALTEAAPGTRGLAPGMYAEQSAEGWAVWLVDEDGDWHEQPSRGEVLDPADCTYYRLVEVERCCDLHQSACCDPDDCGPCCARCPSCPSVGRADG